MYITELNQPNILLCGAINRADEFVIKNWDDESNNAFWYLVYKSGIDYATCLDVFRNQMYYDIREGEDGTTPEMARQLRNYFR